ncbi:MAG: 4Fe-4S dicluster domain-containing protein [Bryobacterales bacterium]|nr:4Fe-4S dicluster domain-containing protein [Bryobacterales bacterium]
MVTNLPAIGTQFLIDIPALDSIIGGLRRRGYEVLGPVVRGAAVVYDAIEGVNDLPAGAGDEQEAGAYRLTRREDGALFGFVLSPHSWKKFLHPPEARLFAARRDGRSFRLLNGGPAPPPRYAFLGVRACELAAIAIQDRVLLGESYSDATYRARRQGAFLVAVNCTWAAPTCFCTSMRTAPPAEAGFDLALTELVSSERHVFVIEAGSRAGAEVLAEVERHEASPGDRLEAERAIAAAKASIWRKVNTSGLRELLYEKFDDPRWDHVAQRCFTCGNCTQVCPTCFCTTVDDSSDVTGQQTERWRRSDSCFSQNFTFIHGGSVRMSAKSRYRQWLTHKLGAWVDQFGSPGCVGCGRCITWCPAGIDITQEAAALRADEEIAIGKGDAI